MEISSNKFGTILTIWLETQCSPEKAEALASELEYEDSKKSAADLGIGSLMGELALASSSLVIFAVNQTFENEKAASVVESLLANSNETVFATIEAQDSGFRENFEQRSVQYFEILHHGNPFVEFPEAFLANLDENLPSDGNNMQIVFDIFDEFLNRTIDLIKLMDFSV